MRAGKLRHYGFIVQPLDSMTAKGDDEITYDLDNRKPIYFGIDPLGGRELQVARQLRADNSHRITVRYDPNFNHRSIIQWQDGAKLRTFNLTSAIDTEMRHIELVFYAVEIF